MASYVYKPECHLANENGFVKKDEEYYIWLSMNSPDNRMMNGNQPVEMRFISDTMESTQHMASGKFHTSKSKFRKDTKAYGCVEVGNETKIKPKKYIPPTTKRQRREDIKKSLWNLGMVGLLIELLVDPRTVV